MRDADAIIQLISRAFSETPQPAPEVLFNHHCCECAEVSAAYAGKRWTDISLDDVLAGRETALLSAVAWRYYLPAVMIWCIRAPDAVDVIQDNLVYQLEPPAEGRGVPEWFNERATGFSEEQRAAIAAYLHWYREREETRWAGSRATPACLQRFNLLGAESAEHSLTETVVAQPPDVSGRRFMDIANSSRHSKVIGEFGEVFLTNWLWRSGSSILSARPTGLGV